MKVAETYDYLVRSRRDLWATLERVRDEVLSRNLLNGERLHCIKDLIFHAAVVEDCWLHEDILGTQPVVDTFAALKDSPWRPLYGGFPLHTLLEYWREERYTVDGLLWHVMIHEMRHTAQSAVLLRTPRALHPRGSTGRIISPSPNTPCQSTAFFLTCALLHRRSTPS